MKADFRKNIGLEAYKNEGHGFFKFSNNIMAENIPFVIYVRIGPKVELKF